MTAAAPAPLDPLDRRRLDWARGTVAALTAEEKVSLLHQYAPAVPRLGIGPFVTGTEGVHGLAWRGPATQFPQPVGLAASWDPELLRRAAGVVAEEVRGLRASAPSVSLTVWAPVVNLLRHPLWGRTEEAYTEDPLLNAELGTAYSRGLRGDGPVWRTVPTLKHFLAYSNETDRCATSSDLPPRVLHELELPGFVAPLAAGAAGSVMLSYNLVDGRPAHLSDLVGSVLRAALPDPDLLFVVSDAGAPGNLFRSQHAAPDAAHAYAAMLRAGVDSFTDNATDPTESVAAVHAALEAGLVDMAHVDRAVVRQLVARARTGEFAAQLGDEEQTGAGTPADGVPADRAGRRALAREAATRGAVLLARAEPRALPLPARPIAVLGAQAQQVLGDWYSGDLIDPVPLAAALSARRGADAVRVADGLHVVALEVPGEGPVLRAADGALHLERPAVRPEPGEAERFVLVDLGEDVVALRSQATGLLVAPDDRGRLLPRAERVGGWVVQETFRRESVPGAESEDLHLLRHVGSGRLVGVEHHTGDLVLLPAGVPADSPAAARLRTVVLEDGAAAVARATEGAAAAVLVLGNEPHVHGRETEDRPHLRLPAPDRAALQALAALPESTATVLVITSSYPYDLEGLEEQVGAVVWSAHAGEAEGEALADLLTGARDFSGRLAQTWPTSAPLPSVLDYDTIGTTMTYQYGQEAAFCFGHGLALDPCRWDGITARADEDGAAITVRLEVSAPAARTTDGPLHEVVQVYADVPASSFSRREHRVPVTRLVGSAAVAVPAAGAAGVEIRVPVERLALYAPDLEAWELPDGPVTLRVARSSSRTEAAITLPAPSAPLPSAPAPSDARPSDPTLVPAHRAEETHGLLRSPASLLTGTVLRAATAAGGTAAFVLPAGTRVVGIETTGEGAAELIDAAPADPALPLPHTVPADGSRPTGTVRVRLTGRAALTGLRIDRA